MSTIQPVQEDIRVGPIESFYATMRGYLPNGGNCEFVNSVETRIVKVTQECDKAVTYALGQINRVRSTLPTSEQAKQYIVKTGEAQLVRVQGILKSALEFLGGQVEIQKENVEGVLNRLLSILEKAIQVNSLLVKNTFQRTWRYINQPSVLVADGGELTRGVYIRVAALFITLRDLFVNISHQVFESLGAQYVETKEYAKVLFKDLKNSQRIYETLSEKMINFKRVTVKAWKRGIEIAVDKKHYSENVHNIVNIIIRAVGEVFMNLEEKYDNISYNARELYQRTVRNYKTQKVRLENDKVKEGQKNLNLKEQEQIPTSDEKTTSNPVVSEKQPEAEEQTENEEHPQEAEKQNEQVASDHEQNEEEEDEQDEQGEEQQESEDEENQ